MSKFQESFGPHPNSQKEPDKAEKRPKTNPPPKKKMKKSENKYLSKLVK